MEWTASIQMTPIWLLQLTCWWEGETSRGTMTSLRNVPVWASLRFNQENHKTLHLSQSNPWYQIRLKDQWMECSCPSIWRYWWMKIDHVTFQPRKPAVSWAAQNAVCPVDQEIWLCLSTVLLWDPNQSAASISAFPSTRETWTCQRGSRGKPQKHQRISPMKSDSQRELGLFSRSLSGEFRVTFQCLKGAYRKDKNRLFTWMCRDNGFKLKKGGFWFDARKKLFTIRVVRN